MDNLIQVLEGLEECPCAARRAGGRSAVGGLSRLGLSGLGLGGVDDPPVVVMAVKAGVLFGLGYFLDSLRSRRGRGRR